MYVIDVISMPKPNFESLQPLYTKEEAKGIYIYLEQSDGKLENVSLELIGEAKKLAPDEKIHGIIIGHDVRPLAELAIKHGADVVYIVDDKRLRDYTPEPYTKAVTNIVKKYRPDIFLIGATQNGCDLAGRLAIRLQTGLIAHVTGLEKEVDASSGHATGNLIGWVPGFGGGIAAAVQCPDKRPQMFTVRPGVFTALPYTQDHKGEIYEEKIKFSKGDFWTEIISRKKIETFDITKAERIIAVGRGIEGNMKIAVELAQSLHAEIGGTRVAVDEGWISKERMIGQTGYTTKPKVAIVCGVSGATQFTIGIENAGLVVAINNDEDAPIFENADLCIVDDLFKILPRLTDIIKSRIKR